MLCKVKAPAVWPVLLICSGMAVAQTVTVTARIQVAGEHVGDSTKAQNVVVWLNPLDPRVPVKPFPSNKWTLTQRNKNFEPHVLVIPVGAVVQFPNRDPFFHNVFSLFEGKRFDLGLYEAGTTRNVSFDRPGVSYIFCNIHAEMSAVIIALDSPYFAISSSKGEVVIPDVPPGRYKMHLWYEAALPATLDAMTRELNITADSSSLGMLQIPAAVAANSHKNKYGMDYEPPSPDTPGYAHP